MPRIFLSSPRAWTNRRVCAALLKPLTDTTAIKPGRRLRQWLAFSLLLLVSVQAPGQDYAQNYQDGKAAYLAKDYDKALSILKPLADQGNGDAQVTLGLMYDYGHGVERDPARAIDWYTQAAEQGMPVVQHDLGVKYFQGMGIERDYDAAARWWHKAAAAGLADSQFNLGLMYYRGLGIRQNYTKAIDLFQRAANQEHANAQYSLAVMYAFGQGVDKNYQEALRLFRAAADQDVAQAQYNLGVFYENGHGVQKNLDQARTWYAKAADKGVANAADRLASLKDQTRNKAEPETIADQPQMTASNSPSSASTSASKAAAAPSTADKLRRENWVRQQDADHYTLQLISLTDAQGVRAYLLNNNLDDHGGYVAVTVDGVKRYNAIYGQYASYEAAKADIESLPKKIRQGQPWVRNFGILHKIMQ